MLINVFKICKLYFPQAACKEKGFTLIEILIAMLILTIVVFAFTPLLLGSIERIFYAGDKSDALYEGQSLTEVNIAEQNTIDGYELVYIVGDPNSPDTTVTVPGGVVETEVTKGNAAASLSGFVPFVPTINLDPSLLVEGYGGINTSTKLTALGRFTDFQKAKDQNSDFEIISSSGQTVQTLPIVEIVSPSGYQGYDEHATFNLQSSLTNSGSPYTVSLKWLIDGGIGIDVRSRLFIALPFAITVGEGQSIKVSPDAEIIWSDSAHDAASGSGTYNDVIWSGFEYVAVTKSGRILIWKDGSEPSLLTNVSVGNALNSIRYSDGNYMVVGNSGQILSSNNAAEWVDSIIDIASNKNLNSINWSSVHNEYVIVGSSNTVLVSNDGVNWDHAIWNAETAEYLKSVTANLYGVAFDGSNWVAVGEESGNGIAFKSSIDGWSRINLPEGTKGLNDIIFDGTRFVAVGNNGTIVYSKSDNTWEGHSSITLSQLNSITYYEAGDDAIHNIYIAVGNDGKIFSCDGDISDPTLWIDRSSGSTQHIFGVAVR